MLHSCIRSRCHGFTHSTFIRLGGKNGNGSGKSSGGGQKREWIGKKLASDWKLALKENQ